MKLEREKLELFLLEAVEEFYSLDCPKLDSPRYYFPSVVLEEVKKDAEIAAAVKSAISNKYIAIENKKKMAKRGYSMSHLSRPRAGKGNIYVRWMGAFLGGKQNLSNSLEWELNNNKREVAAEAILMKKSFRALGKTRRDINVGLVVREDHVTKTFSSDCWSYNKPGGELRPTKAKISEPTDHTEVFVNNGDLCAFDAIVFDKHTISNKDMIVVVEMARKYGLKIISIDALLK